MAAPLNVFIYIPNLILNEQSLTYLFGYYKWTLSSLLITCTTGVKSPIALKKVLNCVHNELVTQPMQKSAIFSFVGVLQCSKKKRNLNSGIVMPFNIPVSFVLRFEDIHSALHLESLYIENVCRQTINHIILYDSCDLISSRLIFHDKAFPLSSSDQINFLTFLYESFNDNLERTKLLSSVTENESINFIQTEENFILKYCMHFTITLVSFMAVILNYGKSWLYLPSWLQQIIFKVIVSTRVGRQVHQRFQHFKKIAADVKSRNFLSLNCKNLIYIITIDLICGWIISAILLQSNVSLLLDCSINQTNYLVNGLKKLIYWLMGVPAGLKLNIPLNNALGHFFLYHIYLWEAYMTVVLPVFSYILNASTVIGFFGATFVLCLLSDLISLATVHIYCFYGYATRLYGYQMLGLCALWRLFRGKKWNPLRERVDSFAYDTHQLFLGTLIFTVLLFLLPTVMVYYFVFATFRIMVLAIQGLLSKIIDAITIFPVYSAILRILSSSETTGDVFFTVLNAGPTLVLSMKTVQIPLMKVIHATLPELHKYEEYLTWKEFLSNIIWGKIVYPL